MVEELKDKHWFVVFLYVMVICFLIIAVFGLVFSVLMLPTIIGDLILAEENGLTIFSQLLWFGFFFLAGVTSMIKYN